MKHLMLSVTALCALGLAADAQVLLTPGDTYTHTFSTVPESLAFTGGLQQGGDIRVFVDTNSITPGAAIRYEFFETGMQGGPVASGTIVPTLTNFLPHLYTVSAPWIWLDREGGFRLTGLSGSVRIVGLHVDVFARLVPSDASSLRQYTSVVALPRDDLRARIATSCVGGSCVDICWPGLTSKTYQVQHQSNLTTNAWLNLGPPVAGNGTNCITDAVQAGARRFYRIREAE